MQLMDLKNTYEINVSYLNDALKQAIDNESYADTDYKLKRVSRNKFIITVDEVNTHVLEVSNNLVVAELMDDFGETEMLAVADDSPELENEIAWQTIHTIKKLL